MHQEKKKPVPDCAACSKEAPNMICMSKDGSGHKGCPTLTRTELLARSNRAYEDSEIHEFAHQASVQEGSCYANRHQRPYVMQPTKTRMVEICEFAKRMGYKRLGLAFCAGLKSEAAIVEDILKAHDFEVVSVCCKAGRTSKDIIDIEEKDKVFQGTDDPMCDPVFQAMVLNEEKTQFNVLLGLCVGHDSLFFKHAEAYTTVLAAKDRVTGHNPLAAIYLHKSYYKKLTLPPNSTE